MRRTCLQHVILLQKAHLPMAIWMPVAFFLQQRDRGPFLKIQQKTQHGPKTRRPKWTFPIFFE